jgi:hypothetical protein
MSTRRRGRWGHEAQRVRLLKLGIKLGFCKV